MKRQHCSEQDLLEINNEFQNLKKEKLSVTKYAASFTEFSKVKKLGNGLLVDYDPMVKLVTTLKVAI